MRIHASAKTTPLLRLELVRRVRQDGETVTEVAHGLGLSRTTVHKWLSRFDEEGETGLLDRRSTPHSSPRRTAFRLQKLIQQLRQSRALMRDIARQLRMALSTVAAVLRRLGLNRLPPVEPAPPVIRYERERPGELLHVDVKKLGRFRRAGHRAHGDRRQDSPGAGWEYVHVCIDDHTRLAYVEVLSDERKETAAGFIERAVDWYRSMGIEPERVISDNGSCYRSKLWKKVCERLGMKAKWTQPYTPRTNGKAERLIQTLIRTWAYGRYYRSSAQRRRTLPAWLRRYNERRPHHGIGGLTPLQRLEMS